MAPYLYIYLIAIHYFCSCLCESLLWWLQYSAGLHLGSGPLMDDEKMATLSLSDRLPSGQVLSQVAPSQSPYSVGQLPAPIPNIGSHIIFNQKLSALGLHYFQRY